MMWFDLITYSTEELLGLPDEGSEMYQKELPFFTKFVAWQYKPVDFFPEHHTALNCWGFSHYIRPDS